LDPDLFKWDQTIKAKVLDLQLKSLRYLEDMEEPGEMPALMPPSSSIQTSQKDLVEKELVMDVTSPPVPVFTELVMDITSPAPVFTTISVSTMQSTTQKQSPKTKKPSKKRKMDQDRDTNAEQPPCVFKKKRNRSKDAEGNKKYHCEACQQGFTRLQGLKKHLGAFAFECLQCDFIFTSKWNRDRHIRSHRGIKPFVCPNCDRSFADKASLVKHTNKQHSSEMKTKSHTAPGAQNTEPAPKQLPQFSGNQPRTQININNQYTTTSVDWEDCSMDLGSHPPMNVHVTVNNNYNTTNHYTCIELDENLLDSEPQVSTISIPTEPQVVAKNAPKQQTDIYTMSPSKFNNMKPFDRSGLFS